MARWKGRTVSVEGALPAERVVVHLTRGRRGQLLAAGLEVQAASPFRVEPRCRHFGVCGGCRLQHLDYPQQLLWKRQLLEQFLAEPPDLRPEEVRVIAMESPWAYRNKLEFTFAQAGPRILLGFHERGSFRRVVDIVHCAIAPAAVEGLLAAVREGVNRLSYPAYDPRRHQGFWRFALVRATGKGQLLLMLITNEGPSEPVETLAASLPEQVASLASIFWGISSKRSDVAIPDRTVHLFGADSLEDQVGPIRFQVGPRQFVQPNLTLAPQVYAAIREQAALTGRETVYDLYCGMGLLALSLACAAGAVVGVESDPDNVAAAQRNASANRIANAQFFCGKVEDLLRAGALFRALPPPDVIVLDPPRAGLHREVYAPLLASGAKRILYLSCNPASLTRDLQALAGGARPYRVAGVQMFDFFPHTLHQEVLVTLKRALAV